MKENNKYRYTDTEWQYQNEPVLYYRYFAFGDRLIFIWWLKLANHNTIHCYIRKYHF